jgi:hypothetical protein
MESKKMKVLSPIAGKEGSNKTHWMRAGIAFENRDGSINIYLNLLPTNGKLQLRDYDEPDRRLDSVQFGSTSPGFSGGDAIQASGELAF